MVKVIQRHDVSASLGPTRGVGVYQMMVWTNMRGHSEWRAQAVENTWEKGGEEEVEEKQNHQVGHGDI